VALPLIVAGSISAHAVGLMSIEAIASSHERHVEAAGGLGPLLLGLVSALAIACAGTWLVRRRWPSPGGVSLAWFFVLPPLAWTSQEVFERISGAEALPFESALE
jgi:hypothetical protein